MSSEHRQSIAYSISVGLLLSLGFYLLISIYDHADAAADRATSSATAPQTEPLPSPNESPHALQTVSTPRSAPAATIPPTTPTSPQESPAQETDVPDEVQIPEHMEEPPKVHTYETTAYYLNVRERADARSRILGVLERGTVIEVAGITDNGWLQLTEGGYVHGGYAKLLENVVRIASIADNGTSEHTPQASKPNKPTSAIQSDSGLSADDIARILDGTELADEGLEEVILEIEEEYGINAYFTIAVMKLESGNGESKLAKKKNNLFGLNAIDGDAFNKAFSFKTKADSIRKFGQLIADNYVDKGYTTIEKVAKKYCPANAKWPSHVKTIMKRDYERV